MPAPRSWDQSWTKPFRRPARCCGEGKVQGGSALKMAPIASGCLSSSACLRPGTRRSRIELRSAKAQATPSEATCPQRLVRMRAPALFRAHGQFADLFIPSADEYECRWEGHELSAASGSSPLMLASSRSRSSTCGQRFAGSSPQPARSLPACSRRSTMNRAYRIEPDMRSSQSRGRPLRPMNSSAFSSF